MADIEPIVITERRPIPPAPLRTQILDAMREDAHRQKSHRELDAYLSAAQSSYLITSMLQSLRNAPHDPFVQMAERLMAKPTNSPETVLGANPEEMMRRDPLFSELDPHVFQQVLKSLREEQMKGPIFHKGEKATCCYLITKGSVTIGEHQVGPGHFIALYAVQPNSVHTCDCTTTGCSLCRVEQTQIEKLVFENSVQKQYSRGERFQQAIGERFKKLTKAEIVFTAQLAEPFAFDNKQVLARKNTVMTEIYVVCDVFSQKDVWAILDRTESNQARQQNEIIAVENAIKVGDVIGADGVLFGKEEKRDWVCDGVVEGYYIQADVLNQRMELLRKMKE